VSESSTTLTIDRTWDGEAVPDTEHATLTLRATVDHLEISVSSPYFGDPQPDRPAGATWSLWEYEVVELFIAGPQDDYLEIELGPHRHHLVLQLSGVRNIVERGLRLDYTARVTGSHWRGLALLPWSYLPDGPYRLNAFAMHGEGDERRYLAMTPVPGDKPDFHRLGCFEEFEIPPRPS